MAFGLFSVYFDFRGQVCLGPKYSGMALKAPGSLLEPCHGRGSARRPGEGTLPPFNSCSFLPPRHHYPGESSRQLTALCLPDRLIERRGQQRGTWGMRGGWPVRGRRASARFKGRTGRVPRNWPPALQDKTPHHLENGNVLHSNTLRQNHSPAKRPPAAPAPRSPCAGSAA